MLDPFYIYIYILCTSIDRKILEGMHISPKKIIIYTFIKKIKARSHGLVRFYMNYPTEILKTINLVETCVT